MAEKEATGGVEAGPDGRGKRSQRLCGDLEPEVAG